MYFQSFFWSWHQLRWKLIFFKWKLHFTFHTTNITKKIRTFVEIVVNHSIKNWIIIMINVYEEIIKNDFQTFFNEYDEIKNLHMNLDHWIEYVKISQPVMIIFLLRICWIIDSTRSQNRDSWCARMKFNFSIKSSW